MLPLELREVRSAGSPHLSVSSRSPTPGASANGTAFMLQRLQGSRGCGTSVQTLKASGRIEPLALT
jgi:hypothetical protein